MRLQSQGRVLERVFVRTGGEGNQEKGLVLTGFEMGFCITGGVLGIRCNLESSSFEPPGSLYIYRTVRRDS